MTQQIIKIAKNVIDAEINGLKVLSKKIDKKFVKAVNILKKNNGKIVVTGVGKSGIIAKKVASTLSSTGSPSQFIHSTEASHGDLGMINKKDVILAFQKSFRIVIIIICFKNCFLNSYSLKFQVWHPVGPPLSATVSIRECGVSSHP